MKEQRPAYLEQIFQQDWEKKLQPVSKNWWRRWRSTSNNWKNNAAQVKAVQQQLLEKVNCTSKNSSLAPSSDPPNTVKKQTKRKSGKKRGGQPGHKGHNRSLYSVEQCKSITDHYPKTCGSCGEELSGEDANPYRHQIVEIPPISPIVIEHRLHQLFCHQCGKTTRATLPVDVNPSGYGVRVVAMVAMVAVLSGL